MSGLRNTRNPPVTEHGVDGLFAGSMITEAGLREHIAAVKKTFPKAVEQPHMLQITALAFACERMLDHMRDAS